MSNPTLINLPPPPSDPITPSDIPSRSGTPNSTTTSMSELSTVAIKDGHRGHNPNSHKNPYSSAHSDAERADRISRLAGLERVTTARGNPPYTPNQSGLGLQQQQQQQQQSSQQQQQFLASQQQTTPVQSYFDASGNPAIHRERSTVGSASATGSVGARTTWADSSDTTSNLGSNLDSAADFADDASMGGMSEEGTPSLVAFGEGARTPARMSVYGGGGGTPPVRTPRADGAGGSVLGQREREEGMEITSQDRMTSHIEEERGEKRGEE